MIATEHRYAEFVRYARAVRTERKRHVNMHQINAFERLFDSCVVGRGKPCVLLLDNFLIYGDLLYGKSDEFNALNRLGFLPRVVAKHFDFDSPLDEIFHQMPCRHRRAVAFVVENVYHYCYFHFISSPLIFISEFSSLITAEIFTL